MPKTVVYNPETKRFTQLNNPVEVKPPPVVLTNKEKEELIKEFKEIFKREPTEEEKEELFLEELKIKQNRTRPNNKDLSPSANIC